MNTVIDGTWVGFPDCAAGGTAPAPPTPTTGATGTGAAAPGTGAGATGAGAPGTTGAGAPAPAPPAGAGAGAAGAGAGAAAAGGLLSTLTEGRFSRSTQVAVAWLMTLMMALTILPFVVVMTALA